MRTIQSQSRTIHRLVITRATSVMALPLCAIALLASSTLAMPAVAQPVATGFTPPPPPPSRDAPGQRGGAAGRGCGVNDQEITALVPQYRRSLTGGGENTQVWGTTTAERPAFWFYVPYKPETIASLEFVLQDNATPANDLYRSAIAPPTTPGIVKITLPAHVSPLQSGQLYQWYLKVGLRCSASVATAKPSIKKEQVLGWVQRVTPAASLTNQLKQATPEQRANLYAQNGIWFDALTTVGDLRLANPRNQHLAGKWNQLLQAVDLAKLMKEPLVPCCHPKPE